MGFVEGSAKSSPAIFMISGACAKPTTLLGNVTSILVVGRLKLDMIAIDPKEVIEAP